MELQQSPPEGSTHLETGQVLKSYRGQKRFEMRFGLLLGNSISSMAHLLELILVPWILSTRFLFKWILYFGGACIYCQTLSSFVNDKDLKTWFSVTWIILFPEGTMHGGRTTELSQNQTSIDTQCVSCVSVYMKHTHHMCIQTLAKQSQSLHSVVRNWS